MSDFPTKYSFQERVLDTITVGRTIPTAPNQKALDAIFANAARYFWDNNDYAHELEWLIIKQKAFDSDLFRNKRKVQLPDCVHAVANVQTTGRLNGASAYSFGNQTLTGNVVLNGYLGASSGDMLYAIGRNYYADFQRNFILKDITFDYNTYTHQLTIMGRNPTVDVVCEAYLNIPQEALYGMDQYFRYVCGKCKVAFTTVYGITDAKMLGGIGLTLSDLRQEGKEEIQEVLDEIKAQRQNADFFDEC